MVKNKKGVALLLAMFVLVFISLLFAAFANILTSDLMITANHQGRLRALYIANAGIEYAVARLRSNRDWSATEVSVFPAVSTSSYTVTYPQAGTTRIIECTGRVDNNKFSAKIEAQVSISGSSSPYTVKIVSYQET